MRIKLTLERQGGAPVDVVVTVEPTAPLSSVAEALATRDPAGRAAPVGPVALRLHASDGSTSVPPPDVTVAQVSLRSGSRVSLAPVGELHSSGPRGAAVATLRVHSGPDAGREFPLPQGSSLVGRSRRSHVRLSDGLVSKEHARINVADTVEVVDLNSANGVLVDGAPVERVVLGRDDSVLIGDTRVSVVLHRAALGAAGGSPTLEFNRSPRIVRRYEGETFTPPEAPVPPPPGRLPWISLLAPLLMGAVLYAVTRSVYSLLFVAMSPVLGLGTYLEGRIGGRRSHRAARALHRQALDALREDVDRAHAEEVVARQAEVPPVEEVAAAVVRQSTGLWSRRPDVDGFLQLRLGSGTRPSRTEVEAPRQRGVDADLVAELAELREHAAQVDGVPVVADLLECGSVGVGGPGEAALAVARGLVLQLVGLHSPSDLVVAGVASATSATRWSWAAWLPHVGSAYSPLPGGHLESTGAGCAELVGALADLVDARAADREAAALPRVVLLVENDAPVLRARLVHLAERGPAVGVHLLWVAPAIDQLPAACRAFVDVRADGSARAGLVHTGETVTPLEVEPVRLEQAQVYARVLAPVVDVGALVDDDSDLPTSVTTLALAGTALGSSAQSVVDRWAETDSLHPRDGEQLAPRRTEVTLRALVGQAASSAMYLDLLSQGPHALVGGTTGAGKSEFLQTWVLSMAASYSPERVTFLFVDYKGGSAFKDCVDLPHSVGMVTDLSPHLVRRALASLNAELTHREKVLHRHRAKDLAALEKKRAVDCPPRLVIVVDEFAALVSEVPEFVDGVVNVAQRGRSLGLHLILATQRPTGVIKENLRANTNLRVALRMNDETDSVDVLGSPLAAGFGPEVPGRAAARTGPGRVVTFQSSYSGAYTPDEAPPPDVQVEDLVFGPARRWEQPETDAAEGPTDIDRLAWSIGAAARQLELAAPRRPWLPVLAAHYDVADLPRTRKDEELVIGVADAPAEQDQPAVAFHPDVDGNLVVFGTGGTGKSATLRTIAVVAGLTLRGGPCQVYGIDAAGGALSMLVDLPHVGSVIRGDDTDRVLRLLRDLDALVDERSARYAAVRAGTLPEYRVLGERPDEPRILLLVDGFAAFRAEFEASRLPVFALFQAVVAAGRQVGVHVVVSADRPVTLPSSIGSAFQQRLTLRLADDNDYSLLGLPADVLSPASPAGRGILAGREVQVAVLGKRGAVADQAAAVRRMGQALRRAGTPQAPAVGTLPTLIDLSELPDAVEGLPALGIEDRGLRPVGFRAEGCLVVCGAPRTGRTTVAQTLVASAARLDGPPPVLLHIGAERSPLRQLFEWDAAGEPGAGVEEAIARALALAVGRRLVAVVEDAFDPTRLPSQALLDLAECAARSGHLVIGVGEPADLARNLPLTRLLRADRQGVALCPDQGELSSVFQVTDVRIPDRNVFPPGRGFLITSGKAVMVQVAVAA